MTNHDTLPLALTQEQARKCQCPVARTFHKAEHGYCVGGACIAWRWIGLRANDPRFISAVQSEMVRMADAANAGGEGKRKEPSAFHKAAVDKVSAAPWGFMIPNETDRGFCGLAGRPV